MFKSGVPEYHPRHLNLPVGLVRNDIVLWKMLLNGIGSGSSFLPLSNPDKLIVAIDFGNSSILCSDRLRSSVGILFTGTTFSGVVILFNLAYHPVPGWRWPRLMDRRFIRTGKFGLCWNGQDPPKAIERYVLCTYPLLVSTLTCRRYQLLCFTTKPASFSGGWKPNMLEWNLMKYFANGSNRIWTRSTFVRLEHSTPIFQNCRYVQAIVSENEAIELSNVHPARKRRDWCDRWLPSRTLCLGQKGDREWSPGVAFWFVFPGLCFWNTFTILIQNNIG